MTAPPNFRYIEVKSCYNCAHIEFDYAPNRCVKYKDKLVGRVEKIFPDGTAQIKVTDIDLVTDLFKSWCLETGKLGDWESECGKYKLKRGQDTDFNTVCDDWEAKE